jgi:hypothetical protein
VRTGPSNRQTAGGAFASIMSCVWDTTAQRRPSSRRISVCHTIVVRPLCRAVASPLTIVPFGAAARNFVLD